MKIQATKHGRIKVFAEGVWDRLPPDKNGWLKIGEATEKFNEPGEKIPLTPIEEVVVREEPVQEEPEQPVEKKEDADEDVKHPRFSPQMDTAEMKAALKDIGVKIHHATGYDKTKNEYIKHFGK